MRAYLVPAVLAWTMACNGGPDRGGGDDGGGEVRQVDFPDEVMSGSPVIALRITNGGSADSDVYKDLNKLANERIDWSDLLMRGGIDKDQAGAEIVPVTADIGGTAPEQVAAFHAAGGTTQDAVDACGNPMIGAFVTPRVLQHAGAGDATSDNSWPDACVDAECDTTAYGLFEVVLSETRFDGHLDMIVNVAPTVGSKDPGMLGHLLAYWLTPNNPGFLKAPVFLNADKAQVGLFNVWKRQKLYTHPGLGTRDVLAMPHEPRTIDVADLLVSFIPQKPDDCVATWEGRFSGLLPYGCADESPLVLDRNAPMGNTVWAEHMAEGTNAANLAQLVRALEWQVRTAAACPSVETPLWVQQGKVELFLCPESLGDLDHCIAAHDMEEFACRPVADTETVIEPLDDAPISLTEQREPYVLRNPLLPLFVGTEVTLELTVDDDTVLYTREPLRLTTADPQNPLPAPIANTHCPDDEPFRYDLGAAWGPGTYTVTVPWTLDPFEPELWLNLTSVPTWVF